MFSTISFPDRGPWGTPGYPGACSGRLIEALIDTFDPKSVVDPAEGSGTTGAVCASRGLTYWGSDLSHGFDIEQQSLSGVLIEPVDLVFLHPPLFRTIRYSGTVWGQARDLRDLSHETVWWRYIQRLLTWIRHGESGLAKHGHVALLTGDVTGEDGYYCALAELMYALGPKHIEAVIVRHPHASIIEELPQARHQVLIGHEYCLVIRADPVRVAIARPKSKAA